jgi:hypothetical protein
MTAARTEPPVAADFVKDRPMPRPASLALLLGLSLAACVPYAEPAPTVSLPRDAVEGATDPLRASLALTSSVFARPQRLAGQPAVAARAIASMEYLAVDLPENARTRGNVAAIVPQLQQARAEWRGVLGITADAAPQQVINQLFAAARAIDGGDQAAAAAALSMPIFTRGGPATLAALNDLPPLPLTNTAAVNVSQMLQAADGSITGRR